MQNKNCFVAIFFARRYLRFCRDNFSHKLQFNPIAKTGLYSPKF